MTTSGGKLISQMKLVSALNMSPSGMRLHFYSLTLHVLKLISWTCRFTEAPRSRNASFQPHRLTTFSSSHLIRGLDLITDLSWMTSAAAPRLIHATLIEFLLIPPHFRSGAATGRNSLHRRTRRLIADWFQHCYQQCCFSEWLKIILYKWHSSVIISSVFTASHHVTS